jgi:hypothetical protein
MAKEQRGSGALPVVENTIGQSGISPGETGTNTQISTTEETTMERNTEMTKKDKIIEADYDALIEIEGELEEAVAAYEKLKSDNAKCFQEFCKATLQRDELLAACKAMRKSIRHSQSCKAPQAFPCSCDAEALWWQSETAIKHAEEGQ